ncbi:MAG: tryptophan--tRNA ligase [Nanoarchaeota archaeon]|nr:tryptophan--tRNA ligase [Nanoarchaeota archaeon]
MTDKTGFVVTPWEVSGKIDYNNLIKQFGTVRINDVLIKRIEKHTGPAHFMLRRGMFFSHRDLNWLLDKYEKKEKFYLYTGRGPSGRMHLGHLMPFVFTKWLQDKFKAKLVIQMTDDEKFMFRQDLELEQTTNQALSDALDIIALGFKPKNTEILIDTFYSKTLYNNAIRVAKKITFSTIKAVFGFNNSTNIGSIFYTSFQAVPAFLESVRQGKNVPCLIPHGIDQDPHFRVSRDVMPKLGYYKPAAIHNVLMPGLKEGGKMSSSDPSSAIYTTDSAKEVKKKIGSAFSGGRDTVKEHREKGGNPDVDMSYQLLNFLFEPDDKKLKEIYESYKNGDMLSGELKAIAIEKVNSYLANHQKERVKAKKVLEKFLLRD